jgi:hypothetical protein
MPALVTPFRDGAVDFDALKSLVDWQIAEGSHGLVPVGTTGESPTLTHDEHEKVIEDVVTAGRSRPRDRGRGVEQHGRGDPLRRTCQGRGRRCRAGGDALLQQADAKGPDRPFRRAERDRPADHHLQHPAALGDRHAARHDGRTCQASQHRRREGRDGGSEPRVRSSGSPAARASSSCRGRTRRRWASTRRAASAASA